jgi:hypothetical protein
MVPVFLVPGVFLGAVMWWALLAYFLSRFKKKIRIRGMVLVNKIGGIVIIVIGVVVLLSVFTTIKL